MDENINLKILERKTEKLGELVLKQNEVIGQIVELLASLRDAVAVLNGEVSNE